MVVSLAPAGAGRVSPMRGLDTAGGGGGGGISEAVGDAGVVEGEPPAGRRVRRRAGVDPPPTASSAPPAPGAEGPVSRRAEAGADPADPATRRVRRRPGVEVADAAGDSGEAGGDSDEFPSVPVGPGVAPVALRRRRTGVDAVDAASSAPRRAPAVSAGMSRSEPGAVVPSARSPDSGVVVPGDLAPPESWASGGRRERPPREPRRRRRVVPLAPASELSAALLSPLVSGAEVSGATSLSV